MAVLSWDECLATSRDRTQVPCWVRAHSFYVFSSNAWPCTRRRPRKKRRVKGRRWRSTLVGSSCSPSCYRSCRRWRRRSNRTTESASKLPAGPTATWHVPSCRSYPTVPSAAGSPSCRPTSARSRPWTSASTSSTCCPRLRTSDHCSPRLCIRLGSTLSL
eukprot:Rmarinus@m.12450